MMAWLFTIVAIAVPAFYAGRFYRELRDGKPLAKQLRQSVGKAISEITGANDEAFRLRQLLQRIEERMQCVEDQLAGQQRPPMGLTPSSSKPSAESPIQTAVAPKPSPHRTDDLTKLRNLTAQDQHRLNWLGIRTYTQLARLGITERQRMANSLGIDDLSLFNQWVLEAAQFGSMVSRGSGP